MTENELYTYVLEKAVSYGMKPKNLPGGFDESKIDKQSCVVENGNAIVRHSLHKGAYIGLIDPGKNIVEDDYASNGTNDTTGAYTGLSFVVSTQCNNDDKNKPSDGSTEQTYCIVSIGIGSSSLGDDLDLASKPGFRRSFMNLTEDKQDVDYFFVENWAAMEGRCPGLKEKIDSIETDGPLHCSLEKYDKKGLLPAACVIKLPDDIKQGIPALDAWLARYAMWRGWVTNENQRKAVEEAICNKKLTPKSQNDIEEEIGDLLEEHKFIVLQGAPGCGKTWTANKIADSLEFNKVFFTQFHAETTYADFVYGIKPKLNGTTLTYEGKSGILLDAIDYAARNNEQKVLLIIDEINRANLANVLGPVFYLFEPNAMKRKHELYLGQVNAYKECNSKDGIYSVNGNKEVHCCSLPDNLYVIATMNTADKSLAVVDFALRRRFAWYTLFPRKLEDSELQGKHFNKTLFDEVDRLFEDYATDEELNLQPGHSYFITTEVENNKKDELNNEMKHRLIYEIMPLMKEYFAEGYLQEAKNEFAQLYYKYTKDYMYK